MKECNQCGKCCINYGGGGLSVSQSEIDLWEIFRPEIYRYVNDGKIWVSPVTGKQMLRCPWLRKLPKQNRFICRIYNDRPAECRHYPVTVEQMVQDECEMLEVRDLIRPRQAQNTLNRLMADSRPPFV
jgi:Fe-S-cluster containining protein